jgi:polysaccharide deacetylase
MVAGLGVLSLSAVYFLTAHQIITVPPSRLEKAPAEQRSTPADQSADNSQTNASDAAKSSAPTTEGAQPTLTTPTDSSVRETASAIPPCDKPDGLGLSRIVQIDTTSGPEFGLQHLKGYDFLRDKEVVLTFDDGPWPGSTEAVVKALADQCVKATFYEIGQHASWHPEITKQVITAGMTVGTHTWSHKDLARKPYAKDLDKAEREIRGPAEHDV